MRPIRDVTVRRKRRTMIEKNAELQRYFSEKAKGLQEEIELEIRKIGGEQMLISREDLIHWVWHAREQVEMYHMICKLLENRDEGAEFGEILQELRETMETDRKNIAMIQQKHEKERKAMEQLQEEADYYQQTLAALVKMEK